MKKWVYRRPWTDYRRFPRPFVIKETVPAPTAGPRGPLGHPLFGALKGPVVIR